LGGFTPISEQAIYDDQFMRTLIVWSHFYWRLSSRLATPSQIPQRCGRAKYSMAK